MTESNDLTTEQCQACRADAPQVSGAERTELQRQIPAWEIVCISDVDRLRRIFSFSDFRQALAFTVSVGELAETLAHHPQITTEWGRVTVDWWTHKIAGLHRNDFIAAAKTDRIYGSM